MSAEIDQTLAFWGQLLTRLLGFLGWLLPVAGHRPVFTVGPHTVLGYIQCLHGTDLGSHFGNGGHERLKLREFCFYSLWNHGLSHIRSIFWNGGNQLGL